VGGEQQCPLEVTTTSIWRTPWFSSANIIQPEYNQFCKRYWENLTGLHFFCHRKGNEQRFLHCGFNYKAKNCPLWQRE